MDGRVQPPLIQVVHAPDGTTTYLVAGPPSVLPPVLRRDLSRAWDLARQAAGAAAWGTARQFRFTGPDGGWTDLALRDRDACCWADALDRSIGIQTSYGLSLCLRLLALIDLLTHARWAASLFCVRAGGATLHPALLRAAADATLTREGGLDETQLRAALAALPAV